MYSSILIKITDITLSIILIISLAPLFLIISFLIKFIDKGPIFFTSLRVGKNGKLIKFYKFKTMINDNITPLGRYLRRASIDELPQIIHVLFGQMSIVGPRPLPLNVENNFKDEEKFLRRSVSPGITGYAQIYYKGNKRTWDKKIEYDIYFVKNTNYLLYLKIILKTFNVLLIRFTKNKSGDTL